MRKWRKLLCSSTTEEWKLGTFPVRSHKSSAYCPPPYMADETLKQPPVPSTHSLEFQTQLFCLRLPLIPSFEFLSNKTNDADVRSRSQKAWHRFQLVLIGWQWMGRRCRSDIIYPSPLLTCTLWPRITGRTSQESVTVMLVWHLYLFFFFVFFYNLRCPSNVPNVRYLILSDTVASHACTQYFVFSDARIQQYGTQPSSIQPIQPTALVD